MMDMDTVILLMGQARSEPFKRSKMHFSTPFRDGIVLSAAGDQGIDVALPPMHHIPVVD
jgi:hypothetical protein